MALKRAWKDVRKVLCIRLDSLGDVLMTMPAVRALKESLPACQITLLTSAAGAEPVPYLPEVDDVLVYEAPWMKASPAQPDSAYDLTMIANIAEGEYDAAVIFTVFSQSPLPAALFCQLANIPARLAHCRENPYHLLTDWVPETEPEQRVRHEVRRQLDLVAAVGCTTHDPNLHFQVSTRGCQLAREHLLAAGVDLSRPWITLHPGVSAPSRQYSPTGYAQAARRLAREDGLQIIFTGSDEEVALVSGIQAEMDLPSYSLAGQLDLAGLAGVLKQAPLLISNNTGPVHLAAAVGTPVVDLYALTNPQHTPWGIPHRVLNHDVPCRFCYKSVCPEGHHHCLALVTPDQVVAATRSLLLETSPMNENRKTLHKPIRF